MRTPQVFHEYVSRGCSEIESLSLSRSHGHIDTCSTHTQKYTDTENTHTHSVCDTRSGTHTYRHTHKHGQSHKHSSRVRTPISNHSSMRGTKTIYDSLQALTHTK